MLLFIIIGLPGKMVLAIPHRNLKMLHCSLAKLLQFILKIRNVVSLSIQQGLKKGAVKCLGGDKHTF